VNKLKRIKQVRIHHEGNHTLVGSALFLIMCCAVAYAVGLPDFVFYALVALSIAVYAVILNFFRCPKRRFQGDTADVVVAPADGKVVVNEEVEENEYFGDRRHMVSIFMSLVNVHANWFPVDGYVTRVEHQNGNFHMAWLPKASLENEHSTVIIRTPRGQEIMVRQVAGALARRIVTYARPDEECYIDEHLGFIKFGSRVDLFLPLDAKVEVSLGQSATGNQTVIARLKAD
jgi:phosphatidylserine decarboxylase